MKIYVVTDLEGVSGVSGFDTFDPALPGHWAHRQQWVEVWAEEVNAAIRGAVAAGARDILVLDNHSAGASLPRDGIAAPARLIHGSGRPTWLPMLDDTSDALVEFPQKRDTLDPLVEFL